MKRTFRSFAVKVVKNYVELTLIDAAMNLKAKDERILYHAGVIKKDSGKKAESQTPVRNGFKIESIVWFGSSRKSAGRIG